MQLRFRKQQQARWLLWLCLGKLIAFDHKQDEAPREEPVAMWSMILWPQHHGQQATKWQTNGPST
jgi:hypothetical protein